MSDETMQATATDGLCRAADRISDASRWCRWYPALQSSGHDAIWGWNEKAVRWSAGGAIEAELGTETVALRFARACFQTASRELFPHRNAAYQVDEVNDLEGRKAAIRVLRRAAEIAARPDSPAVLNPPREVIVWPAEAVS